MRFLAAAIPLVLVATCWAASIPPSGEVKNENSTQPTPPVQDGSQAVPPAHPMLAYLSLRPVLPVKPAFFSPFVDPNAFVDRKAALLSGLFGIPQPAAQPAPPAPAPGSPPSPLLPFFAPGYFAAKKNSFLSALFAAQQQPVGQEPPPPAAQARRALPGFFPVSAGGPPPGLAFAPSVFAAKKQAFLLKLFETLNATAAPTTPAPLPSWLDFLDESSSAAGQADAQAPLPRVSLAPAAAASAGGAIDPSIYADKKKQFLNALYDSIGLPPPTPKPSIVPPGFWSPFAAPPGPVFPGPKPPGKSSPCPMCKTKVAGFLSKLIQQINATAAPASELSPKELREAKSEEDTTATRRGLAGPLAGSAIGGPFGAGKPFVGGPFGAGKPFKGGPFGAGKPFIGGPFGIGKPFIGGPFGIGKPFGPAVDPQFFMDKKTTFLNQLIASKAVSPDGTGTDIDSAPDSISPYGPFAPAPKPTIVPPDFWNPFPTSAAAVPAVPAAKPTIVPPNFWSPFAAQSPAAPAAAGPVPAGFFADKKAKFLSTLFAGLQTTPAPAALSEVEQPAADEDDEFDSFLQALAEALATPDDVYLSRRGLDAGSGSAGAARQQLIDSAVAQMATLKNDIVGTVNEILAQKAAAAQQPAFPFAKSPYAAYGAMKKGGPPPGVMKKGPPPGVMKKGGPMAGGFPFWGGAAPTPDPTAELQQRLQVLSQAFDSLATLEKDASAALQIKVPTAS